MSKTFKVPVNKEFLDFVNVSFTVDEYLIALKNQDSVMECYRDELNKAMKAVPLKELKKWII